MYLYQTYKYNENNKVEVIQEFNSLIEAYLSIDETASVNEFKSFFINKLHSTDLINESMDLLVSIISQARSQLNLMRRNLNINNLSLVKVLSITVDDTEINNFIVDNEYYISDLNQLLNDREYSIFIRKNPACISEEIRKYLQNNLNELLSIMEQLIERGIYTKYNWQRGKINTTNINTETDDSIELVYDQDYNENDLYNYIQANIIYSITEYDVLQSYIEDIDNIINIIVNNIDTIKELSISRKLINIFSLLT